ncbi:MAG: hypothetical protein ABI743_06210 [bacterium]
MDTLVTIIRFTIGLWFLPAQLLHFSALTYIPAIILCCWVMVRLVGVVYADVSLHRGPTAGAMAAFWVWLFPPLWIVWYMTGPQKEGYAQDRYKGSNKLQDVRPVWEEAGDGHWQDRWGWERAKDTLHVERDLLAGKSLAAITADLEREMTMLPPMWGDRELAANDRDALYDAPAPPAKPEPPVVSPPTLQQGMEPEPWKNLGLPMAKIAGGDDDYEDRVWTPPPPPKYVPPQIDGVSDYAVNRLYSQGKFDEVVAYLSTRRRIESDRGGDTRPVDDYLRLARAQQLHRELEKYRAEYDREALMTRDEFSDAAE